jgi:hypothetical protein
MSLALPVMSGVAQLPVALSSLSMAERCHAEVNAAMQTPG